MADVIDEATAKEFLQKLIELTSSNQIRWQLLGEWHHANYHCEVDSLQIDLLGMRMSLVINGWWIFYGKLSGKLLEELGRAIREQMRPSPPPLPSIKELVKQFLTKHEAGS